MKTPVVHYSCFLKWYETSAGYLSLTLFHHFQQTPAVRCLAFKIDWNQSPFSFWHIQQDKTPAVPYFRIFNGRKPKTYHSFVFLTISRTLQNKTTRTLAIPHFSIFNNISPKLYIMLVFLIDRNHTCNLI